MPSTPMRRPLPALVVLLALTLLAALVWWRVLSRSHHTSSGAPHCSTAPTGTQVLPAPGSVTVVVLNSTNRSGLAGTVRSILVRDGFQSPDLPANDRARHGRIPGVAEIRYAAAQLRAATLLHYYLPGARLRLTTAKDGKVVVSLGNKYRAVATPAAVRAAMARDHVTAETAPTAGGPSPSASC
jgi:hypothetical protein